jgi:hypothetical protein
MGGIGVNATGVRCVLLVVSLLASPVIRAAQAQVSGLSGSPTVGFAVLPSPQP